MNRVYCISKIRIIVFFFVLLIMSASGCSMRDHSTDKIYIHDTVYVEKVRFDTIIQRDTVIKKAECVITNLLQPHEYNSVETRNVLRQYLWSKQINQNVYSKSAVLERRSDLEYLPYLLSACSDLDVNLPSYHIILDFITLCTEAIDDKGLYDLGKRVIENLNKQCGQSNGYEYPDSFSKGGMEPIWDYKCFEPTPIDTLRVKALVYNDREALDKLEKYYHDKGGDKGIAIYYKVLLSYEGNGDLAERFYHVLEPYFVNTPQFKLAVRQVLLRAALCDKNARAQELCDSLGFSLCDYRLPVPAKASDEQ